MTPKEAMVQAKAVAKAGDFDRAAALYEQVLARAPKHTEAGKALRKLKKQMAAPKRPITVPELQELQNLVSSGDFITAKTRLARLLPRAPKAPFLHLQSGLIEAGTGHPETALTHFRRALELDPDFVDARINLAIACGDLGLHQEAIEACETGLKTNPENTFVLVAYSENLMQMGSGSEAEKAARKATELTPGFALAWMSLGQILNSRGQKQQAIDSFEQAVQCEPDMIGAHVELVRLLGRDAPPEKADRLAGFLNSEILNPMDAAAIHFALADMFDGQGDVESAFRHYAAGNQLRHQMNPYDHVKETRQFEAVKRVFAGNKLARIDGNGVTQPRPIFIVGMNRSGTSLVEQILAGHSDVHGAGELDLIDQFAARFEGRLERAASAELQNFRDRYLSDLANRSDRPVITDKMPINYRWIGLILHLFPNAQIIALERSPGDVCFSNFKASFGSSGHAYSYDMVALAQNYAHHLEVMTFWKEHFGGAIKSIRYETLIEAPEQEARALLAWLGLDWQPQVMEFHKLDRTVRTLSQGQVHQGIYTSSVGRWKPYATYLMPLMDELERLGVRS
ncbi:MAG: tetratricopeptide repeat protein [Rhodobacteraceae bacterium]|nr:tetratricopeptide repeat protein [Paracoccaceae bacterium]